MPLSEGDSRAPETEEQFVSSFLMSKLLAFLSYLNFNEALAE